MLRQGFEGVVRTVVAGLNDRVALVDQLLLDRVHSGVLSPVASEDIGHDSIVVLRIFQFNLDDTLAFVGGPS